MTLNGQDHAALPDLDANLASLVARQARLTPDAIAIVCERAWTYRELHERQMAYARGLSHFGLAPEATVAVFVPRHGEMAALLLAILWCGLAYVPIDPEDPAERGRRIHKAASCQLIVAAQELAEPLREAAADEIQSHFVEPAALIEAGRTHPLPTCAPGAERLAYVLFTSGSTGEPKGVEIEHRQLVNLLFAANQILNFGAADRYLAIATIAFDVSVVELFLPLLTGGSLLLRDRSLLRDPDKLISELRSHAVTVVQIGPSSWSVLLNTGKPFPHLRVAISTGEPISPALAARLPLIADAAFNLYGPTEITVWATGHRLTAEAFTGTQASQISAPIGTALDGYALLVADAAGRPVADGQDGELLVGGRGLARGYRERPDLTADRFVRLGPDKSRYYRTGDMVRRDGDGVIHYFGRNDDQIKVRGVRIEPREIEASLLRVPGVKDAAATWFETGSANRGIVAAIVWIPGQSIPFDKLHGILGHSLPQALVPSRFVAVDRLPITASGKIDRAAIRNAEPHTVATRESGSAGAPALTETEARLVPIWARTLGLDKVDGATHFFSEGGDSLSAVTLILDVEKAFGIKLDPDSIWSASRLRDFAGIVEAASILPADLRNTRIVFPLVKEGRGAPMFFSNLPPEFARDGAWTLGCPLHALAQWSLGKGFERAGSIAELARAQIAEIRGIQKTGPFRIGGHAMGGLIALEIAGQLRAAGQDVELLFLLDPTIAARTGPSAHGSFRQRFQHVLLDLYGKHPSKFLRRLLPANRQPAFWHKTRTQALSHVAKPYEGRCLAMFEHRCEERDHWRALLTGDAEISSLEAPRGMFEASAVTAWTSCLSRALSAPVSAGTRTVDN